VLTACDGFSGYRNFLHVYDPDADSWTALAPAPHAHGDPAAGVIGGKLYVAGGLDAEGAVSASLDIYDPATDSWSTGAPMPTARSQAAGGTVDGKLYVIGGSNGSSLATVEAYDPVGNTWSSGTPLPEARHGLVAAGIGGLVYAAGGTAAGAATDALEVFDPAGCPRVERTLANGDPNTTNGALSLTVDGLGAFGSATGDGDAVFNPRGPAGAAGTTFSSNLYLSAAGRLLADDGSVDVCVVEESPLTTETTIGSLQIGLTQELGPIAEGGSTLTQRYTLTNLGETAANLTLVRHIDGDLRFDGTGDQDGAAAGPEGRTLFLFDSAGSPAARAYIALSGSLGADESPDRWTIQRFDYRPVIEGSGGIPEPDHGVIEPTPDDMTLSQQWNALSLPPKASVTLTTRTRFDTENHPPTAVADAVSTLRDEAVDVNPLANDSDADGDPITLASVTQPANGTASINPNGTVRYAPAAGFSGSDSFTYTIGDGRGGTAVGTVTITVQAPPEPPPEPQPQPRALVVAKTGDGVVRSAPPGIDCGGTCTAGFEHGTLVTLVATPDPGWTFGGWGGACTGLASCVVLMDAAKGVEAAFLPPPPRPGQSANASVTRGTVLVRVPGTDRFVELEGADQIPIGSQIDTTAGAVAITVARGATRDTSEFYDGRFTILQANAQALGEMRLEGGDFLSCLSQVNLAADRRPVRRLWGSGRGRFRTRGRYASASVRGTKWLTEDACGGTLTRVEEGSVVVHDFGYRRDVVVRAGQSYFAEPLPRGIRSLGCTLIGSARGDLLRGTAGRDVICGLGGNDILIGLGGDDVLYGGTGADRLFGRAGDDLLDGGLGNDYLSGGADHDVLRGGAGNDFMIARDRGRGNDRVIGGPGRDRCRTDWIKVCP
jgi:Ca2+-binding RTX toxin-like protein